MHGGFSVHGRVRARTLWTALLLVLSPALAGCLQIPGALDGEAPPQSASARGACDTSAARVRIGYVSGISLDTSPLEGLQAYVDLANAEGGVEGRCVTVVVRDSRDNALLANAAVSELANMGIRVIVGPTTSDNVQASLPIALERKLVLVSPSATRANLTGSIPYFFRTIPSDAIQGPSQATLAYNDFGAREVVFLYQANAYGAGLRDRFIPEYEALGGRILGGPETYGWGGGPSINETAAAATALEPPLIIVEGVHSASVRLILALRDAGYAGPILASEAIETRDALVMGGSVLDGVYYTKAAPEPGNPHLTRLQGQLELEAFTTHGFDAGLVVVESLRAVGADANANEIRAHLLKATFEGTVSAPKISFTEGGDIEQGSYHLWQILDGRFEPATAPG